MPHQADETFALINELLQRGEEFCIATIVRTENATSAKAGARAVVLRDGRIRGHLGGGCVRGAVQRSAAAALQSGQPRLIRIKPKDEVTASVDSDGTELHKSFCPSGGTVDMLIEPMRRPPRVIVCGASPVAVAVAELAQRLGYRIAVAALEEDQAAFNAADERLAGFDLPALPVTGNDWIVIATQGKRDLEALTAALVSDAGYVGFVSSRRKAAALSRQLREKGVSETQLARLTAPAGLDINGVEPAEIAVSIIAEIIARRRATVRQGDPAVAATASPAN